MPKRKRASDSDKIDRYLRKIRKLEEKSKQKDKHRLRILSSESEQNFDNEELFQSEPNGDEDSYVGSEDTEQPQLDPEILTALGEATPETPNFGPKIHESLAQLWLPILRKGLNNEMKEKLSKEYLIPDNCALLKAPKLNPEISAAASEATRARDKKVESVQQQLGQGITALNKGLELLIDEDGQKRLEAIKYLSDSCRLLCDLHYIETEARKKFVTPGLDKAFLTIVQDVDRDELLFGNKLSEKIKASKVIEKQGLQIKKAPPNLKTNAAANPQPSTSRGRSTGNWSTPRYPSNRGGRGGAKRTNPAGRGRSSAPSHQAKTSNQSKQQRATPQQQ